jgi:TolB-like protein/Tfp pilus assembly protein PilF
VNPRNFFAELKRRNVVRMAGLYLVGAWLLTQVASTVLPTFDVPSWALRGLIITLALGFLPALIFSWVFELTPQGLKRDEDVPPEQSIAPQTARRMNHIILAVLVLALGYFAFDKFVLGRQRETAQAKTALEPNESKSIANAKSIAVLPFENLSSDKENAYFADGIQDEILTRLATIADLKVISRTSTTKYKSKPEDLKTVSQQLGVANILEGSVQKAGDKVRVNVQLIDARSDSHLWAKSYDGDARDIFGMETEVSQQVADALRARLSPAETQRLAGTPTANPEAYDLFLKAEFEEREAESTLKANDFERAAEFYRQALKLDPNFAPAHSRLVMNRMQRHWYIDHLSAAELQPIQEEAERALELAPNLPEAHIARGVVYYFGHRQYEEALAEFRAAIRLQPNNARAFEYSGYVHRRLGRWKDSFADLKTSLEQDPRNSILLGEIATSYGYLRMWKEARDFAQQAGAINPHDVTSLGVQMSAAINEKGDVAGASRLLAAFAPGDALLPDFAHAGGDGIIGHRAGIALLEHDTNAALRVFGDDTAIDERRRYCARVVILLLSNDKAGARSEAAKALSLVEAKLRERPEDLDAIAQASWVYLGLNRNSDAIAMAKRAADFLPPEKDALVGPITLVNLAQIECRAGHAAEAIAILRRLLSIPGGAQLSIPSLRINPMWDSIRNDPAFQRLLTMKEHVGP